MSSFVSKLPVMGAQPHHFTFNEPHYLCCFTVPEATPTFSHGNHDLSICVGGERASLPQTRKHYATNIKGLEALRFFSYNSSSSLCKTQNIPPFSPKNLSRLPPCLAHRTFRSPATQKTHHLHLRRSNDPTGTLSFLLTRKMTIATKVKSWRKKKNPKYSTESGLSRAPKCCPPPSRPLPKLMPWKCST